MKYFVHEFRVQMVVENVSDPERAKHWMDARLNGGDASFEIEHTASITALTPTESEEFYKTGKYPSQWAPKSAGQAAK